MDQKLLEIFILSGLHGLMAMFFAGCGFFLMYLVAKIIEDYIPDGKGKHRKVYR